MSRFLPSFLNLITDLAADAPRFLHPMFRSRTAFSTEVLFLRKQLAFYEDRQVQPRGLSDAVRFSLVLWSRLFDWRRALVIVKPEMRAPMEFSRTTAGFWEWSGREDLNLRPPGVTGMWTFPEYGIQDRTE
jgi:hypothetical protein